MAPPLLIRSREDSPKAITDLIRRMCHPAEYGSDPTLERPKIPARDRSKLVPDFGLFQVPIPGQCGRF